MSPTYTLNQLRQIRGRVGIEPLTSRTVHTDEQRSPMPLIFNITIGDHSLSANGDFQFGDEGFRDSLRQFINAISEVPSQLDTLAAQLESQTAALAQAVSVHQPPTEQEP